MRVAISFCFLLAACGQAEDPQENRAAAPADVEVLPPDESAATTSGELANGVNEPDVGNLGDQH